MLLSSTAIVKIYLFIFERERLSAQEEGQRERERISDSPPSMEPNERLELMTLSSLLELKSRLGHLTDCATQAPHLALQF